MCKLDVNSPLPQGNGPPSTFQLIWTKNERHEYVCDMLIVCFAVGRDWDNWWGRKAWREGKGFSPSFCWFLSDTHWVSLCVSVLLESQSCTAYYEKSNFNRANRNKRQSRQHVFSPSGTAWFCRACWRDGHRRRQGLHSLNLSHFASITSCCCPTSHLNCSLLM